MRLEEKAEDYRRKGSQPVIEEDDGEERSEEADDLEDVDGEESKDEEESKGVEQSFRDTGVYKDIAKKRDEF